MNYLSHQKIAFKNKNIMKIREEDAKSCAFLKLYRPEKRIFVKLIDQKFFTWCKYILIVVYLTTGLKILATKILKTTM